MRYLKEQLWLYHPEVDDVFEWQDFSQALMIMDMQSWMLNPYHKKSLPPPIQKLTERIRDEARILLENNGIVCVAEYTNRWSTVDTIKDVLDRHSKNVIYLEKECDMLHWKGNSRDKRLKNNRFLSLLREKRIPLELCWVSIRNCIKLSGIRMYQKGLDIKIPIGLSQDIFNSFLMTSELLEEYWEYSHLLDFWNQGQWEYLRYVSDYL